MSAETQTTGVPHARYTETKRASYGSQQEVAEAWADGLYPTHNGGELYSSSNFKGRQRNDGTGVLRHYRTREAIRTRTGLILNNSQCWARGMHAHCSPPFHSDARVPLSAVESETDREHTAFDITAVHDGEDMTVVEIDSGAYGVAFGWDRSIINGPSNFIFRLSDTELDQYASDPDGVTELLTPAEVRESDRQVVDSREFTKFHLSEAEAEEHRQAGGKVDVQEKAYGTYYRNHQQFRADLQGEVIVRQGEWFLIPVEDLELPVTFGDGVPFECAGCGKQAFDVDDRRAVCKSCGHQHRTPGDTDQDMDSHLPSEGVTVDGVRYVRGVLRHLSNDHNAVRLGETWHRAVTHDRDVTVYDTGNGGSRGD